MSLPMSHFAPVQSLDELAARLRRHDQWDDERTVVDAVDTELQAGYPSFLMEATGEWKEPYLLLVFTHEDGTVFNVSQGDGYTAIVGGGVNYHGYLDTSCLIDVLVGLLRGRATYVHHSRLGYTVARYFEVVGREGQRLGHGWGLAGAVPFLVKSIPLLPESVGRTRVSFDRTPAITVG